MWHKTAKIPSVTSRAVDIIRTAYLSTLLTWLKEFLLFYMCHIWALHTVIKLYFFLHICYNDPDCLHILCRSHTKKNVLLKFIEPSVWPPTVQTWVQLIRLYMRALQLSTDLQRGRSQRQSVHTCWENVDQQIVDKSIGH